MRVYFLSSFHKNLFQFHFHTFLTTPDVEAKAILLSIVIDDQNSGQHFKLQGNAYTKNLIPGSEIVRSVLFVVHEVRLYPKFGIFEAFRLWPCYNLILAASRTLVQFINVSIIYCEVKRVYCQEVSTSQSEMLPVRDGEFELSSTSATSCDFQKLIFILGRFCKMT